VTLRTRIAAAAGVAVAATAVALAVIGYAATRSALRGQIDSALGDRARPFALRVVGDRGGPPEGPGPAGRVLIGTPRVPFGGAAGSAQVVGPDGKAVLPPGDTSVLPVDARTKAVAAQGAGRFFQDVRVAGTHLRVLTVGIGADGAVQIARPLTEVDRTLSRLLLVLAVAGGAAIALAALLGAVVARTALAPIARFTRRTEALTGNLDLSQRLEPAGDKDELARLARSFNTTLDALESSVEAQRHLVADASHELRTPIASLRANVQILEDADRLPPEERASLRADIITELDELTTLVGDIVELARGAKPGESVDDVRVDQVVSALVERAERRATGAVVFRTDLEPTLVTGEPDRISRAVSNLLDNARKWSPPGGLVEVSLAGGTLTVRDHGPGFAEADLPHVFDRFYRAREARGMPGSGLGLAIVRQAAEAHSGSARASNAPEGGAVVHVSFGPPLSTEWREPAPRRAPAPRDPTAAGARR
jgi:two-component system sensor histidine kinase MprB